MQPDTILPVVLCGGSGTRLWPLSRSAFPKQFVPLVQGESLLALTLQRAGILATEQMCVTSEAHRFLTLASMEAAQIEGRILLEPVGRNTTAAMTAAALLAEPDALLLFLPADHHIPDAQAFAAMVRRGVPAAQAGYIVTFGVTPNHPSTAFGYIQRGETPIAEHAWAVQRFIEKPGEARAQAMLLQGGHFWNAGIFLVRAAELIQAVEQHAPDILAACRKAKQSQTSDGRFVRLEPEAFTACRSQSIDHAVMEKHDRVAMVPFEGQWSDVGSWTAVADLYPADAQGNRVVGQGFTPQSSNTFIHAGKRPVVALGVQDLLVIDTDDALLVAHRDHAQGVKDVVAQLEQQGVRQATQHRREVRPWGAFDSVDSGPRFQVKRITVKPGGQLSLQMHHHRAEHWIVVRGTARIVRGEETFMLSENQSTYIPLGVVHRLHNPGKIDLELIEVQSGEYLGEDDIVRLNDDYGRKS